LALGLARADSAWLRRPLGRPERGKALRGTGKRAKTDRLDARWLVLLLAKELLPLSWLPPAEIQQLRDKTRLRKALAEDRRRWAHRLQAFLQHEGWPCARGRLLTAEGRRWVSGLALAPVARAQVETLLRLIDLVEDEQRALEREPRRFARSDRRCQALETIHGIGPILACHILAELGEAKRFRRARSAVRAAASTRWSTTRARRRGAATSPSMARPSFAGRSCIPAHQARYRRSPDRALYGSIKARRKAAQPAVLTVARKIGGRSYHVLHQLEREAAEARERPPRCEIRPHRTDKLAASSW
jgi:transposase